MGNLKTAARLLNRVLSKRLSTTYRKKKRKKAIMVRASLGVGLDPHSLPCRDPILTLFHSGLTL